MASPGMPATEILAHVRELAAVLPRLRSDRDLTRCSDIASQFARLRTGYVLDFDAFAAHLPELTRLRRDFEQILSTRLAQVVDRYQELSAQIRRGEHERDLLREFFIRKAAEATPRFTGQRAEVSVRRQATRDVPPAGDARRTQLERRLQQAGLWIEVSQLSRTRLCRAIAQKRLGVIQGEAEEVCPAVVAYTVLTRLRSQAAAT